MEYIKIAEGMPEASRVCLGTWAIGGWLWGGADDNESIATIETAFERGINFIDTAPVYGFGRAETVVGQAIKKMGKRDNVVLATKAGLEWTPDEKVYRNSDSRRIRAEVDDSLRRLQTDYIDLYQIHWPDELVPIEETAAVMKDLLTAGKIRSVGVSNYSVEQMKRFSEVCPLHTSQPPYNLFERAIEESELPFCNEQGVVTLAYGAICRGLLSGRMTKGTKFPADDLRSFDPKFNHPRFEQYVNAVEKLDEFARSRNRQVIHLAVRWILDQGRTVALWGARRPDQLDVVDRVFGWRLSADDKHEIDRIISAAVTDPIGPEFMGSPCRDDKSYNGAYPVA